MKKAFTLVELLGVIIIISLLALLTSIAVTKLVKDSKQQLSNVQINLIKSSAEMWGADNLDRLPDIDECAYLSVSDLKKEGLLDDSNLDDDIKVKITNNKATENGVIKYEVNPTDTLRCDYALAYRDDSGANIPKIREGLVPVIYDEEKSSWVIADENKEWYDYNNQWWANAVILRESSRDKKVGDIVTVPESNSEKDSKDVLAMFVWIPRYEYTIKSEYGRKLSENDLEPTQKLPGAIDIKFVSEREAKKYGEAKYTGNTPREWYTHPAFTFGDDELTGIWVGKFEPSHITLGKSTNDLNCIDENCDSADGLRILPNVSSLKNNNVSNFFFVTRSMSRDNNIFGINKSFIDTHMMKNSEWGAVAYLSQSKYGKYGKDKSEVHINNCQSRITGIGANNVSDSTSDTCTGLNNKYDGIYGIKASTTGNIYGIYDISGGAQEYVMGNYNDEIGSSSFQSGFFDAEENTRYYDKYTGSSLVTACDGEVCKGHALSETSNWYGDSSLSISSTSPWFLRGGLFSNGMNSGVFNSLGYYGRPSDNHSFRVVFSPIN